MRKVDISEYGIRHTGNGDTMAGQGHINCLWIPKSPHPKHSFIKMLWLISKCRMKTRKEVCAYAKHPLTALMLSKGSRFPLNVDNNDYWAELHRKGYIIQWREGRKIMYELSQKGTDALEKAEEAAMKELMHL